MKINIHTDQYADTAASSLTSTQATQAGNQASAASRLASAAPGGNALRSAGGDVVDATPLGSSIGDKLTAIDSSRAARVAQLAGLYSSGRYEANAGPVAQALVANSISG